VNHDLLIKMVRETVSEEAIITLIKKFLKSGVMVDGLVSRSEQGTPPGGNLSPLLSNIYLTRFDRMLEERGHKFVRYADDCNIYVKSSRAAGRVMDSCTKFLEGELKLKMNRKKSMTGSPTKLKFLGFSLYARTGKACIRVHEKTLKRFINKLREITSRKRNGTMEWMLKELTTICRGWLGYYGIADLKWHISQITAWLRRRIRHFFWKRWKQARTRFENLIRLGIRKDQAWPWANTRKGCWHTAGSWLLTTSNTNQYLESLGFMNMAQYYEVLYATH
jgi:group II intron reverse transcriptase/maturase